MQGRRLVFSDDLVTATEISKKLGISAPLWTQWYTLRSYGIPDPIAVLTDRGIRVWVGSEIDAWAVENKVLDKQAVDTRDAAAAELMTGAQIAELLGWSDAGTAWQSHVRGTFPGPVMQLGRTRLWLRPEVVQWAATHPRRPTRRKKTGTL